MADRKAIQLQDGAGNVYDIKDAEAREELSSVKSAINVVSGRTDIIFPGQNKTISITKSGTTYTVTLANAMYMYELNNTKYYSKRIYASGATSTFDVASDKFFAYNKTNDTFNVYTEQEMYNNADNSICLFWNQGGNIKGTWAHYYDQVTKESVAKLQSYNIDAILLGTSDEQSRTQIQRYVDFQLGNGTYTMTIPKGSRFVKSNTGEITEALPNDVTMNLSAVARVYKFVYYNTNDSTFYVVGEDSYIVRADLYPTAFVLLAVISFNQGIGVDISCPYRINGFLPGDEALANSIFNVKHIMGFDFGNISSTGVVEPVNYKRLVTKDILSFGYDIVVMKNERYPAFLATYASASSSTSENTPAYCNNVKDYVIEAGTYFRLCFIDTTSTASRQPDPLNNDIYNSIRIYKVDELKAISEVGYKQNAFSFNENVRGICHRGLNREAPENTLPAFQLARKSGFEYVETDVAWTSDDVPVLLHDTTIDRTSDGTGDISSMTFDTVREYDFGSWFSPKYAGTVIPSFEEFIVLCRNIGLKPYVELRAGTQQQVEDTASICVRNGMAENTTWISTSEVSLGYVRNVIPNARVGLVTTGITDENLAKVVALQNGGKAFIDSNSFDNTGIEKCITNHVELETWDYWTESAIIALDPYVTGITSDNLVAGKVLYDAAIG